MQDTEGPRSFRILEGDVTRAAEHPRLFISCGEGPRDGCENIELQSGTSAETLPFDPESFVEVTSIRALEFSSHNQSQNIVNEWARTLKPGGRLRISVPSFEWIVNAYRDKTPIPLHMLLLGGQRVEGDQHRAIFDDAGLRTLMERAGLWGIKTWKEPGDGFASQAYALNLEGFKPVNPVVGKRVRAAMTMPRLTFSDNMYCAIVACSRLGIEFERTTGAYFDQNMERVLESQMKHGNEYVLTMDYDTMFVPEDVQRLVAMMDANPDVGAIAAMQPKRGDDIPLISRAEALTMGDHFADFFDVRSSHFGLTLIRVAAMKAMPHPWLHHEPDPNGKWEDGRVDADVGFWHKMKAAGWRVCVSPRVNVGHAQLMVSWVGDDWGAVHQHSYEYWKNGKPSNVR